MADLVYPIGYLLAVLIVGRIVFVGAHNRGMCHDDATFVAVVAGVFWPVVALATAALLPFIAIGWLVSRPTRRDRRVGR